MSNETPQESLQHYFDDLLLEPASGPEAKPVPAQAPEPIQPIAKASPLKKAAVKPFAEPVTPSADDKVKVAKLLETARLKAVAEPVEAPVEAPIEVVAQAPAEVITEAPVEARLEVEPEAVTETEIEQQDLSEVAEVKAYEWEANGRPAWAQERFEVLLFDVAGLTLAVPLIALGQIQPLTDELTPLFGQADWFMGLQPTPVGKIRTVNTAKFVMPERYCDSFLDSAKYVVSINGLPWGLAVDTVNQPITLDPEDVKWRGERSKRAWLAGTVKEHMCALIDIPMMGQMLQSEDANAQPVN